MALGGEAGVLFTDLKDFQRRTQGTGTMDRISIVTFCLTALKEECLLTMEWAVMGSNELLITGGV